jgi:alpha-tubulin suppressor-like RCC1 family protein
MTLNLLGRLGLARSQRLVVRTVMLLALATACTRTPTDAIELRQGASSDDSATSPAGVGGVTGAGATGFGGTIPAPGGSGGTGGLAFPAPITGPHAISVFAGSHRSCALLDDGHVACWGAGILGDGISEESGTAVIVASLSDAVEITAGGGHACARRGTGAVVCWGTGTSGQLGNQSTSSSAVPVTVSGLADAIAIAAGEVHTCAVRAGGGVVCWGSNSFGQLGDGDTVGQIATPLPVEGLSDAVVLTAGRWHTCAVRSTGAVACWGRGDSGQVGNGAFEHARSPVAVTGISDAVAIGAGWSHTCAVRASGELACWGYNWNGQLGNGSTNFAGEPEPVAVVGLSDAAAVAGGSSHTCALRTSGEVACWGVGSRGETGDGAGTSSSSPLPVSGLTEATAVAAGASHSCAARSSGGVVCWGFDGIEGDAPSIDSRVPRPIGGLPDVLCYGLASPLACSYSRVPAGDGVAVSVAGSLGTVGGVQVDFQQVERAGEVAVLGSGVGDPPPLGFAVLLGVGQPLSTARYWTIATNASFSGPVNVCIHYDPAWIGGPEDLTLMYHDDGAGYVNVTNAPADVVNHVVCGTVNVLPSALVPEPPRGCSDDDECDTGFCVDGVCCDSPCGFGDDGDCEACSVAAGGSADGVCSPLAAGTACGDDNNVCTKDLCDAGGICQHPPENAGTACSNDGNVCTLDSCDGSAVCRHQAIPACSGMSGSLSPGPDAPPIVLGGDDFVSDEGALYLDFGAISSAGAVTVAQTSSGPAPGNEFGLVPSSPPIYWDIDTTAGYTPPIIFCVHYDQDWLADRDRDGQPDECDSDPFMEDECNLQIAHFNSTGAGFVPLEPPPPESGLPTLDTVGNFICGQTSSLSPFALVVRLDAVGPVFGNVPDIVPAFATSTRGARVNYPLPTAIDAVDGPTPVTCTPAPGSEFPVGTTPVACLSSDAHGNTTSASFTVRVTYEAPTDGAFFLAPIRPDGSAVFKIGRAVPVKFRLTGASAGITDLVARLTVTRTSDRVRGSADCEGDEDGEDTDMVFRYRKAKGIYGYRWKTRGETQGTYRLRAELGDGVIHEIDVSLRKAK